MSQLSDRYRFALPARLSETPVRLRPFDPTAGTKPPQNGVAHVVSAEADTGQPENDAESVASTGQRNTRFLDGVDEISQARVDSSPAPQGSAACGDDDRMSSRAGSL